MHPAHAAVGATIATTPRTREPFRSVGHDRLVLYLIGGAPRCGKTLLAQRVASALGAGWCSTDTVRDVVTMLLPGFASAGGVGVPPGSEADLFFPYFERTAESCSYLAEDYVVEGVGFLQGLRPNVRPLPLTPRRSPGRDQSQVEAT